MNDTGRCDWKLMRQQPQVVGAEVARHDVPDAAGVYAWFKDGEPVYVGKATSLRSRICGNHLSRTAFSSSAFKRNVAELHGFASAVALKTKSVALSPEHVVAVHEWIRGCSVTWIKYSNADEAAAAERQLKDEMKPRLTKM